MFTNFIVKIARNHNCYYLLERLQTAKINNLHLQDRSKKVIWLLT